MNESQSLLTLLRQVTNQCVAADMKLILTSMQYRRNISSLFSCNSEADSSENIEDVFPRCSL